VGATTARSLVLTSTRKTTAVRSLARYIHVQEVWMDGVSGGPGASALKAVVLVSGAEHETALVLPVGTDISRRRDSATLNHAGGDNELFA